MLPLDYKNNLIKVSVQYSSDLSQCGVESVAQVQYLFNIAAMSTIFDASLPGEQTN